MKTGLSHLRCFSFCCVALFIGFYFNLNCSLTGTDTLVFNSQLSVYVHKRVEWCLLLDAAAVVAPKRWRWRWERNKIDWNVLKHLLYVFRRRSDLNPSSRVQQLIHAPKPDRTTGFRLILCVCCRYNLLHTLSGKLWLIAAGTTECLAGRLTASASMSFIHWVLWQSTRRPKSVLNDHL